VVPFISVCAGYLITIRIVTALTTPRPTRKMARATNTKMTTTRAPVTLSRRWYSKTTERRGAYAARGGGVGALYHLGTTRTARVPAFNNYNGPRNFPWRSGVTETTANVVVYYKFRRLSFSLSRNAVLHGTSIFSTPFLSSPEGFNRATELAKESSLSNFPTPSRLPLSE
jgi:hypothetical protein